MSVFVEGKTFCWKCGAETRVYTWPGHDLWPNDCPIDGRPSTVYWSKSRDMPDGYFANHCEHCGIIQGDWYVFMEPGPRWSR